MAYYYCTCNPKELSKTNVHKNSRHFREVKVDSDGVCLDCKHYAVALPKRASFSSNGNDVYSTLKLDIKPPKADGRGCKGELSEEQLKEIRELIKEGYNNTHIAEIVGISAAMVSNIKTKRVYRG
jgi:hypothetical protein